MNGLYKPERSLSRWASALCIVLVLLVGVQAVHVHALEKASATPCLACVSAQTNVSVAVAVATVLLVPITAVVAQDEASVPSSESVLPLFIRPPPSR